MKASRVSLPLLLLLGALSLRSFAQDAPQPQDPSQPTPQRGQRGGWGGGAMLGRGVLGTVTEIAPDHFTVKTENGDLYTIHYSVNTRIMKGGGGQRRGQGNDNQAPANPPTSIKASEIKIGDAIGASGEIDANAKSVGAVVIFQIDAERAKQMREMQANYGKTWVMGRVTAINDVKVTLQGGPDNAIHTFVADESTIFRKRRDPVTLADIQVGDMIRAEGSIRNGAFLATSVAVMGPAPQRNDGAPSPQ
ncbi:MAG TPA: DUF5666 domain-containing protein [Terracidiphilus sp.]|nr:DUF5666 domain-containing protein [Terracidiphilus sp.]